MILPRSNELEIAREKVTDYLLNPRHPDGAGKAAFFAVLGFDAERWNVLASALKDLAAAFPVVMCDSSPHGLKYVVDGALNTPLGKTPSVRTVWIVDAGGDIPRLVTAYLYAQGD